MTWTTDHDRLTNWYDKISFADPPREYETLDLTRAPDDDYYMQLFYAAVPNMPHMFVYNIGSEIHKTEWRIASIYDIYSECLRFLNNDR